MNLSERARGSSRHWLPALLTLVALLCAVQGQRQLAEQPPAIRQGLLWYAAAVLTMVAARQGQRAPRTEVAQARAEPDPREPTTVRVDAGRWAVMALGVGLAGLLLAWLARQPFPPPRTAEFGLPVATWLASIALVAGAWLRLPARGTLAAWLRAHRWVLLALLAITLAGAWLRLANLGAAPLTVSGDEGSIGLEVRRVLAGELRNPFTLMWGTHSTLMGFLMAALTRIFGFSIGSLRLMGALMGILAVPALAALAWQAGGRRVALAAALLLATFPMHLHYSRVAVIVVWDTFSYPATLAALLYGLQRRDQALWSFLLAGLLAGIGQYPYTGSRLLPLVVFAFLWALALLRPAWLREKGKGLLLMALLFAIVAAPHYLFGLQHPALFNGRLNEVGIVQTGWLEAETVIRGEGTLPILFDQLRRVLFGFGFFRDRTTTWGPNSSLALPLLSAGLFFGLVSSLRRWRDPAIWLLHGWFWSVILTAGVLTVNPPTSNRLISLTPIVCLFAALGWEAVAVGLARSRPPRQQVAAASVALALFVAATALTGVRAHSRYLSSNRFGGTEALIGTLVGRDLAAQPPDSVLVMLTPPRLYADISNLAFLTPERQRVEVREPLVAPPAGLPPTGDLLFIVLPERMGEMGYLLEAFPQAAIEEVRAPDNDELLYYRLLAER